MTVARKMRRVGHQTHSMELLSVNVKLDSLEMEHYAEVDISAN